MNIQELENYLLQFKEENPSYIIKGGYKYHSYELFKISEEYSLETFQPENIQVKTFQFSEKFHILFVYFLDIKTEDLYLGALFRNNKTVPYTFKQVMQLKSGIYD